MEVHLPNPYLNHHGCSYGYGYCTHVMTMKEYYYSQHFTNREMCRTSTGLDNQPSPVIEDNLIYLVQKVLEPARLKLGEPIRITSGYRSPEVNAAVGGVQNSYHKYGLAADIHVPSTNYLNRLVKILRQNEYVDKCIIEHSRSGARWLHVQTTRQKPRRLFFKLETD